MSETTRAVKSLLEIANEYDIHITTLRRWILPIKEELQIKNRKLLVLWQIEAIHKYLDTKPNN